MRDTVMSMLEAEMITDTSKYQALSKIRESQHRLLGFTPQKVMVHKDPITEEYLIEYAHNLERLMQDEGCDFHEAYNQVIREFNLDDEEVSVVVTMEDVMSIPDFSEIMHDYSFVAAN